MKYFFLLLLSLSALADDTREMVAVVDTGIKKTEYIEPFLCSDGHKDFTGKGLNDVDGHGSNIAGILSRYIDRKTQCLLIIKYYHNDTSNTLLCSRAIFYATNKKVKYINLSYSGREYSSLERSALKYALMSGIYVSVAAGNDSINFDHKDCNIFPACYNFGWLNKYLFVVGNFQSGIPSDTTNRGGPVKYTEDGNNVYAGGIMQSGTSQATAIFLGKFIMKKRNKK